MAEEKNEDKNTEDPADKKEPEKAEPQTTPQSMHVVTVIPISRGIGRETLSYFTAQPIPVGSIIKVPLRKKIIPAIVVQSGSVEEMRAEIRGSSFALRKISASNPAHFLNSAFIDSAREAAQFFAGTTGGVIKSLVPKAILDGALKLRISPETPPRQISRGVAVIQTGDEERFSYYKSVIREEFGKKHSVLFCVPTLQDMKKAMETLPKGIEEYTYFFHGSLPKKELARAWNAIMENPHPVLVIGTGSILSLARNDIGMIIIERESAGAYKSQTRPFVDIRTFAEFYRKKLGAGLVLGDLLLRTETIHRRDQGEVLERFPLSFRIHSDAESSITDSRKEKEQTLKFKVIGKEVETLLRNAQAHHERTFLYITRRGLSPLTVCGDCGTVVTCTNCSAPITLHGTGEKRFFLCHRCGERRPAEERCKVCNSWKLVTLGIGSELVEEKVRELFPDAPIIRIDKEATPTLPRGIKAISTFYSSPGSILIGTEMALLYLDKKIENAAIVSIDSLFSIPDFRINEKVMSILARIRTRTEKKFLVQTRYANLPIIASALSGNANDFYREEIKERKLFNYPPACLLIKITYRGEKNVAWKEMEHVQKLLAPREFSIFPAFIESVKGKHVVNGLLRLSPKEWPNPTLLELLLSLPPAFTIKVDPENLL